MHASNIFPKSKSNTAHNGLKDIDPYKGHTMLIISAHFGLKMEVLEVLEMCHNETQTCLVLLWIFSFNNHGVTDNINDVSAAFIHT